MSVAALAKNPKSERSLSSDSRATIKSLTSLRFLAAVMVVISHSSESLLKGKLGFIESCALEQGVSFFFVLSGFILLYSNPVLSSKSQIQRFFLSRFARIWPAHVAAIILFSLLGCSWWLPRGSEVPWITVANICLFQGWIPQAQSYFSLNAPSWSVSTECFFYLAFPFLVRDWSRTWAIKLACSALLTIAIVSLCSLLGTYGTHSPILSLYQAFIYISPLARLFEFVLGMAAAQILMNLRCEKRSLQISSALEIPIFVLAIINLYLTPALLGLQAEAHHITSTSPAAHWLYYSSGAPIFAFLICIFSLENGFFSRMLTARPFVFLGEISYSIYLVHWIVLQYFQNNFALTNSIWLDYGIYWVAVIAMATTIFLLVETPARKLIRGMSPKDPAPRNSIEKELFNYSAPVKS